MASTASQPHTPTHVALGICTYQRPDGLRRLLESLQELQYEGALTIVVVDNHPDLAGVAECRRVPADYRWPVIAEHEPQPGIAQARNTALQLACASGADFIAMLDDDEWAEPHWLSELLRVQHEQNVDFVGGPVTSVFPDNNPPPWHAVGALYYGAERDLPDGARCVLYAAGNFLARRTVMAERLPNVFDPGYAGGGEDLAFFTDMDQRGHTMAWAANAVVFEDVPLDRMSLEWLRDRVQRVSNLNIVVQSASAPGFASAAVRWAKTLVLGALGSVGQLVLFWHPRGRLRSGMWWWKFRGRLNAHLGGMSEYGGHGGATTVDNSNKDII